MSVVTGEKKRVSVAALIAWGCFALAVFGLAIAAAVALGTSALLENSQPYQDSLAAVRGNPAAVAALGEPIEEGDSSPDGSLTVENDTGETSLEIAVRGPEGEGTIRVEGTMTNEEWTYSVWELRVDGRPGVIQLGVPPSVPPDAPREN